MFETLFSYFRKIKLPPEVLHRKEKLLLHIGDITLWDYPYAKRLIKKIRPDVLVHTGDMVDNLKVSRIPEDIPPYKRHAKNLLQFMEENAKEVYIVPGNNDLEDFIHENTKKSVIVQPNTVLDIHGLSTLLCHRVLDIDGEAKFYLYGHGPTGDTHYLTDNGKDGKYYSNVFFAPSVILIESQKCIRLNKTKRRSSKK